MESIRKAFSAHVKAKRLTGAACAIWVRGKERYREAFGFSDCAQTKPLQEDAIYRMASMTKPITAVAVMICKDRGLLDLDVPVSKYVKGFSHGGVGRLENGKPVFAESAREITLRDILTHSSGLGSGELGSKQLTDLPVPESLEKNVEAWNGKLLDFAPKSSQAYSALTAFEVAALAVERVSGKPFAQFLKEEIFQPLGMKDTCYELSEEQIPRLVEMPLPDNEGKIEKVDMGLRGFGSFAQGYTGGSAGLFSTLNDYLAFANMLAHGGEWLGRKILSQESVKEIGTLQNPPLGWQFWGLSVFVRGPRSEWQPLREGSFGWSGAYGTHFWVEPKSKLVAVLMLNHANCGGSGSPFSAEFERLVDAEISASEAEYND